MRAGGFAIQVANPEKLNGPEEEFLRTLGDCSQEPMDPVLQIHLSMEPLWPKSSDRNTPNGEPARVFEAGDLVLVGHESFQAEIERSSSSFRLFREESSENGALKACLKTAISVCLPGVGGVALHAAGLRLDSGGVAFFGVSGAGKSTFSRLAGRPVLSDEFVAVLPAAGLEGFVLAATGFWGTYEIPGPLLPPAPLRGLVALEKTPSFEWERLNRDHAFRRLISALAIPDCAGIALRCLPLLRRLAERADVFRMGWHPSHPPIEAVEAILRRVHPLDPSGARGRESRIV